GDIAALLTLSGQSRSLAPNEDFIRQGDRPETSALVMSGMGAPYHTLASGKRQYLSFNISGDWPDAQSMFIERMDHAVCAIGEALIVMIPHREIMDVFERRGGGGLALLRAAPRSP